MSEKNYMGDPASEFADNLRIGASLQPDAITSQVADRAKAVGDGIVDIARTLSGRVASRHWIGKFRETTCDNLETRVATAQAAAARIDEHVKEVQAVAESAATAKSVCDQNSQCAPGVSSMTQVKAVARTMQNHYHEPGEPEDPTLDYPGRAASAPVYDRGETPDGPSAPSGGNSSSGSSGGAPVSSNGTAPDLDNASAPNLDASSDGADASGSEGKGSDSGGSAPSGDSGGGSGSPAGGTPSAGAGGAPTGATPSAADGAGFDPGEGHTSAMSADYAPGSSLGGAGLGGGLGGGGTLGDHERALSSKSGAVGMRPGATSVNVNTSGAAGNLGAGGMGGAMAPGAMGKRDDKEHRTPDYLKDDAHGRALLGGALPVVTPEVMGELTESEIVKMAEEAKDRGEQPNPGSPPPVSDGPQPRRKAVQG